MRAPAGRPTPRTGRPQLSLESTQRMLHIRLIAPQFRPSPDVEAVFVRLLDETYKAMDSRPDIWSHVDVKAVIVRGDGAYCMYSSAVNSLDQLHLVQVILAGKVQGMVKMGAGDLLDATTINVIGGADLVDATSELQLLDVKSMESINYIAGPSEMNDVLAFHQSTKATVTVFSANPSELPGDELNTRLSKAVSRVPMDLDALHPPNADRSPSIGTIRA